MATINKKMMLCAVVGGDLHDYVSHMMDVSHINGDMVQCIHKPEIERPTPIDPVIMKAIGFSNIRVGMVGRCSCGKIFYKLAGDNNEI